MTLAAETMPNNLTVEVNLRRNTRLHPGTAA